MGLLQQGRKPPEPQPSTAAAAAVVAPEQPMLRGSAWTSNETAWGSNETGAQSDETRIAAALEKRRGIEDAASSAELESAFVGKYFKCRRCQKGGWKSQECHLLQKAKCKGTKYALKGAIFR